MEQGLDLEGGATALGDQHRASVGSEHLPPPRLDAYREYTRGLDYFRVERYSDALQAFVTAAGIDPTFVLPVIWAEHAANNQDSVRLSDSLHAVMRSLLGRLGPRLSPLDRFGLRRRLLSTKEPAAKPWPRRRRWRRVQTGRTC